MYSSDEWREMATEMLGSEGAAFAVTRPASVSRDSTGAEISTPMAKGLILGVAASYRVKDIDGKNILSGDCKFIGDAAEWHLQVGDIIPLGAVKWRVVEPNPVAPDGEPILFIAQLRMVGR